MTSDTLIQAEKQRIKEEQEKEEIAERDRQKKQRIKEEQEKEEIAERDRQEKQRIKEEEQENEEIAERDRQEDFLRLAADQKAKVSNLSVNSLYTHFTDKQINSLFPIFF